MYNQQTASKQLQTGVYHTNIISSSAHRKCLGITALRNIISSQ